MKGLLLAVASFLMLKTVTALWPNPVFIRMTPVGGWEISFLAAQSRPLGLYVAIQRPACSTKLAGTGGVLNFLGVWRTRFATSPDFYSSAEMY